MDKKYNLYGQGKESDSNSKIEYEVVTLPLQHYVSSVRKYVCSAWDSAKGQKNKAKDSLGNSMQAADSKVKSLMDSIGVRNTRAALQITAIGTGVAIGLLMGRRKSTAGRIAYPLLIGGGVYGAFYISSAQNRTYLQSQIKAIQSGYKKNTPK